METTKSHSKLYYITFLQVIGPIFVIIGHMLNGMPYNSILQNIKDFIYVFHMPLFFFISGYLFSYKNGLKDKKYLEFMKKKALRLLLPYFVFNIIFFLPKILMSDFIVDQVEISFEYLLDMLLIPRRSSLGHLWFLFGLFLIYALSPIWDYIIRKNKKILWVLIIVLFMVLYIFPLNTNIFAINDLCNDTLYFVIGLLVAKISKEKLEKFFTKKNFIIYLIIYASIFTMWILSRNNVTSMLLCTTDIFMLCIIPITFKISNKLFDELGSYSFSIYIMHWPTMLLVRIIFYQIIGLNPIVVSFMMVLAGYFIPLAIIKIWKKIKEQKNINSKVLYYLIGI